MDAEPIIIVPRIVDRFGHRRSDDEVIGAMVDGIEFERLPDETVHELAERVSQGRTCTVHLRYR